MTEITVAFGARSQSIGALRAAAYRLIAKASCQIDEVDGRLLCRITLKPDNRPPLDARTLETTFLDLVADENLRESMAAKTEPIRNLILSLAFGALAQQTDDT
jgi:His-Xaa-Ser system protein HxsD